MTTPRTSSAVSRRTALAGLGAGGLGLALAASTSQASAQDAAADMASHPMVGAWLVAGRLGPSMTIVHPNGTWMDAGMTTEAGPDGVAFLGSTIGTWEAVGERGIHFTAVQVRADADGNFLGTFTVDGHPTASEDGQTFSDSDPETTLTFRDADHNVIQVLTPWKAGDGPPPRTGTRMAVGAPGLPAGSGGSATPTS